MTAPEARRVRLRWLSAATFAFSLLAVSGCGGSGPPRAEVGGQVTLDGRPMEEGNLSLIPAEGTKGPTTGAAISGGNYRILAASGPAPGKYKVEITARRKTGRTTVVADGPYAANPKKIDETEQYIPERYNVRSELSVEIVPGENRCDFTLAAKP